jgi:hypothetical protein
MDLNGHGKLSEQTWFHPDLYLDNQGHAQTEATKTSRLRTPICTLIDAATFKYIRIL